MLSKSLTPHFVAALAALTLVATGCSQNNGFADQDSNFFRFVEVKPNSYASTAPYSLSVRSNDIISRANPSGTQVKRLAGLSTYVDC
jgi:hypothetical protein